MSAEADLEKARNGPRIQEKTAAREAAEAAQAHWQLLKAGAREGDLPPAVDVAAGEKIPRKGGPGITKSDLFVINKTDLAPHVGASLDVMRADTLRMRGTKPFVMTNLKTRDGLAEVVAFIERRGMLRPAAGAG